MDPTCPLCGEPLVHRSSITIGDTLRSATFYCPGCLACVHVTPPHP